MKEYNKHIDEDFDFGKIKSKRIEDEYSINPALLRKLNNKLDLTKIIGHVIPDIYKIKIIDYPDFGKVYASLVDMNYYLWPDFDNFLDAYCIGNREIS
jgi:hypothetical protein